MPNITDTLIASFATKGNARRIRVLKEPNGTYSYAEFHRLELVARGCNYPTREAIMQTVNNLIQAAREIDGIKFLPVA